MNRRTKHERQANLDAVNGSDHSPNKPTYRTDDSRMNNLDAAGDHAASDHESVAAERQHELGDTNQHGDMMASLRAAFDHERRTNVFPSAREVVEEKLDELDKQVAKSESKSEEKVSYIPSPVSRVEPKPAESTRRTQSRRSRSMVLIACSMAVLVGGATAFFQISRSSQSSNEQLANVSASELSQGIKNRIDPAGVREIPVRQSNEGQLERERERIDQAMTIQRLTIENQLRREELESQVNLRNSTIDSLDLALVTESRGQTTPSQLQSHTQFSTRVRDRGWDGSILWDTYSAGDGRYGQERYEPIVENAFVRVEGVSALSTFAIDVDSASYANMRRFLRSAQRPPVDAIRIEELINYFSYDDAAPTDGSPIGVSMEFASCPWDPAHRLLRVALKGKVVEQQERPLSNLVFLVDVSGSMDSAEKLPLLRQSLSLLIDQMSERDKISIVTYADNAAVVLRPTNAMNRDTIHSAIDALAAAGSTHGSAGIQMAYDLAREGFIEGGVNRVLLATDGDLNVGVTDDDALVELISDQAESGVYLTVLGFGTGNLQDAKLEKIADHGNGIYAYIDSLRESRRVLLEQMSGTLVTIAKDVKIQMEFNPAYVSQYRLIGYENRAMSAQDFRDDTKDAGEIGAGHSVVALYEIVPQGGESNGDPEPVLRYQPQDANEESPESLNDPNEAPFDGRFDSEVVENGEWVYMNVRYQLPDSNEVIELGQPATDEGKSIEEANDDFRFTSAVAAFGMILRNSNHRGTASLGMVSELAEESLSTNPSDQRIEFLDLVRQAMSLGE